MTQQFDFLRFKSEINLTQYAAHLGYKIDRKKSTRSSVAMKGGADKIIISRRGRIWIYFSVSDDNDNGTIIDFIKNRTGETISEIGRELQEWICGGVSLSEPKAYEREVTEQEYDPSRVARVFKKCRTVIKHDYLEGRGIIAEVLAFPRFQGRIYTDRYRNAAFPHYNADGVCGLELKNKDKTLFVRGSEKTFWRSNCQKDDDTLVISEAVIDALSYYMLFPSKTSIYAATGGGMSSAQRELLKNAVEGFKSLKTIILAMDNDQGGDGLADKITAILAETSFEGMVRRHSPDQAGQDWNDVLIDRMSFSL